MIAVGIDKTISMLGTWLDTHEWEKNPQCIVFNLSYKTGATLLLSKIEKNYRLLIVC